MKTYDCEGCPYRGIDGGPSPAMVCNHPDAEDIGYIISWNVDCTKRGSDKCPLKN
jgi:hypothetical protein